jgi:hypothetical protein
LGFWVCREQKDQRYGKEMGRKKKVINKDESAEGCCFVCKDGGTLRVCDYK